MSKVDWSQASVPSFAKALPRRLVGDALSNQMLKPKAFVTNAEAMQNDPSVNPQTTAACTDERLWREHKKKKETRIFVLVPFGSQST